MNGTILVWIHTRLHGYSLSLTAECQREGCHVGALKGKVWVCFHFCVIINKMKE